MILSPLQVFLNDFILKNMNKKRVLVLTDKLNIGGYDLVAYNFAMKMNSDIFETVFLVRGSEKGSLEDKVISDGFRVIHQPDNTKNYFRSFLYLENLLRKEKYDIVHSHLNFFSGIVMRAAYKNAVGVRVAHAHFTNPCIENRNFIVKIVATIYESIMRIWLKRYCNAKIGCGYEAGAYLFGKKEFEKNGIILNNGVDTNRFCYDEQVRNITRKNLGIDENTIVLGHCGRFNYVKNHSFLLDVFNEYHKENSNSVLLLVGDGEKRNNIEEKADSLGISDSLIITGLVNNVECYYNAMDCFVFPSLYEGFPLTLVEAQATKLPCLISNNVTKDSKINDNVDFESIEAKPIFWVNRINSLLCMNRCNVSTEHLIKDYSILASVHKLEELYIRNTRED